MLPFAIHIIYGEERVQTTLAKLQSGIESENSRSRRKTFIILCVIIPRHVRAAKWVYIWATKDEKQKYEYKKIVVTKYVCVVEEVYTLIPQAYMYIITYYDNNKMMHMLDDEAGARPNACSWARMKHDTCNIDPY